MANNFLTVASRNVGTTIVNLFTVPAATQRTIIGLSIANTTINVITASLLVSIGGVDHFLVRDASIPPGSALVPYGGEQKLSLTAGAILRVQTSAANSADVVVSILDIT